LVETPVNGTCNHLERVSAYHDGELPGAAASEVERHLAGCDACAAALEHHRAMSRLFASAELPRLPSPARRRIRRAIDDERAAKRLRIVRALTAIAASFFLVAASRVIQQQHKGGDETGGPGLSQVADWEVAAVSRDASDARPDAPAVIPPGPAATSTSSFAKSVLNDLEKVHD
jgi:anti-sigma factor RsiW